MLDFRGVYAMEFEKLKKVIAEVLSVNEDEITLNMAFVDDFGADSLDIFQLMMGIESEFGIELSQEAIKSIVTVEDAVELIKHGIE